jgi:hypothetical protein
MKRFADSAHWARLKGNITNQGGFNLTTGEDSKKKTGSCPTITQIQILGG